MVGSQNRKLQFECFNAQFISQYNRKQMSLRHHSNVNDKDKAKD